MFGANVADSLDLEHLVYPADPGNYYRSPFLPLGGPIDPKTGNVAAGQREWALPGFARDAANSLALTVEAPGRALAGQIPEGVLPQIASESGLELAGMGIGAGLATGAARDASLGIFAGRLAHTANMKTLSRVLQFEDYGMAPEKIWDQTGWFRDVEGKMKFEVPDAEQARWIGNTKKSSLDSIFSLSPSDEGMAYVSKPTDLSDLIHHPQLFDAYPELGDIKVAPAPDSFHGIAMFDRVKNIIYVKPEYPKTMVSNILHEANHVVQRKEDFATGGSIRDFLTPELAKDFAQFNTAVQNYQRTGDPRYQAAIQALWPKLKPAYDDYNRLAGEVSSRNVQERFESSQFGHPFRTQGYPLGKQIVKLGDGKMYEASPMEHDPFTHSLEPVEHDPFAEPLP